MTQQGPEGRIPGPVCKALSWTYRRAPVPLTENQTSLCVDARGPASPGRPGQAVRAPTQAELSALCIQSTPSHDADLGYYS